MKLEKGAAFKLLEQEQHYLSHSRQPCRIIDGIRGQTGVNPSFVELNHTKEVKEEKEEPQKIEILTRNG
jgi:hypothetical protein